MLNWLFGKKSHWRRLPTQVWQAHEPMRAFLVSHAKTKPSLIVTQTTEDYQDVLHLLQEFDVPVESWQPPRSSIEAAQRMEQLPVTLVTQVDQLPAYDPVDNEVSPDDPKLILVWHHSLNLDEDTRVEQFVAGLPIACQVQFLTSLEHPLFEPFANDRLKDMLEYLDMKPDECISHQMVDKQIAKMQQVLKDRDG